MVDVSLYKESSVWNLACHISISSGVFAYTLGVFNTSMDNIAASLGWGGTKEFYISLFSTFIPIGQTIGSILTPPALDRFGRRKFTLYMDILFIIGSLILIIPNTVAFGAGRILTGIATGAMSVASPIYLSEVTPVVMMPQVGPLIVIMENIALVISYGLGLMLPVSNFSENSLNELWILMYLLPAVVCLYQILYFCLGMKHDSPQFYFSKQMFSHAESALEITHLERGINSGLRRVNSEIQGKSISGITASLREMICERKFCKMARISVFLPMIAQMSGFIAILFYSTSIFSGLNVDLFQARLITFVLGIVLLLSSLSSIWLLKYFGRKSLIITAEILTAIDLAFLGLFSSYVPADPLIVAVFTVAFFIPFGLGLDTVLWMHASEVLNDQFISLMCTFTYAFSIVVSLLFPILSGLVGIGSCFLFFAVCMAASTVYSCLDLIETQYKTKEEILIEMRVLPATVCPDAGFSGNSVLQNAWSPDESIDLHNPPVLIYDAVVVNNPDDQ